MGRGGRGTRCAWALATVGLLATMLTSPPAAWACSCLIEEDPIGWTVRQYQESEAVFVGVAIGRYDPREDEPVHSSADPIEWTFEVELEMKGDGRDPIVILSARSSASCGIEFELGRRYWVYADMNEDGELWAGTCSGTTPIPPL